MRLLISGLGLVSSLGPDVKTACAACHAGISRACELKAFSVFSFSDLDMVPVYGHPVQGALSGFKGLGFYLHLSMMVLEDLFSSGNIDSSDRLFFKRTGLYIALSRTREEEFDFYDDMLEEELGPKIAHYFKLPIPHEHMKTFFKGNAGGLYAVEAAKEAIDGGFMDRCIILGMDSLVDQSSLELFDHQKRLKTAHRPTGLIPGEAGAAILLESESSAKERGAKVMAGFESIATGFEKNHFFEAKPNNSVGLCDVIKRAMGKREKIGDVYCDLNGEEWRAEELSIALVRLSQNAHLHYPAVNFGDTGAASGLISVCKAVRSLVVGYAESDDLFVISSDVTGEVVCGVITGKGEKEII